MAEEQTTTQAEPENKTYTLKDISYEAKREYELQESGNAYTLMYKPEVGFVVITTADLSELGSLADVYVVVAGGTFTQGLSPTNQKQSDVKLDNGLMSKSLVCNVMVYGEKFQLSVISFAYKDTCYNFGFYQKAGSEDFSEEYEKTLKSIQLN